MFKIAIQSCFHSINFSSQTFSISFTRITQRMKPLLNVFFSYPLHPFSPSNYTLSLHHPQLLCSNPPRFHHSTPPPFHPTYPTFPPHSLYPQGSYWAIDTNPPDDPLPPRHKKRRPSEKSSPYSPEDSPLGPGGLNLTPFGSPVLPPGMSPPPPHPNMVSYERGRHYFIRNIHLVDRH